ncbi:LAMI_0A02696g1_1 [Lachancea mirantina]|uniref:LAMI_0A02696g1_1 n=1 Tax=Lachancea mirantina TaxID=1230905 RepID=A0A1G4IN46_9SACH|nr:LAMI_0A02696g1_1 [Lachancea mirantina]
MSAFLTNVSYDDVVYEGGDGVDLNELNIVEKWLNRPASQWSIQRLGLFQSKIEQYVYRIYHQGRYGKHSLNKVIPSHVLMQFANESFGYSGWSAEVLDIKVMNVHEEPGGEEAEQGFTTTSQARIKLTLKDGTNTEAVGFARVKSKSKGDTFARSKKGATTDALKKCFLKFEEIVIDHQEKVSSKYYVDGLYGSKTEKKGK